MNLTGKAAIVTGGGKGVGRLIAQELASAGSSVAIIGRNGPVLRSTATDLTSSTGSNVLPIVADVTNGQDMREAIRTIRDKFTSIDILVNNAGTPSLGLIGDVNPDFWWQAFEVHVRAPMMWCQAILPEMLSRGAGRIVNVTSTAANWTIPGGSAYIASKAALSSFTRVLDVEVRSKGVFVFAFAPRMKSDMTDHIGSSPIMPPAFRAAAAARTEEELSLQRNRSIDLFRRIISGELDAHAGEQLESEDPPTEAA